MSIRYKLLRIFRITHKRLKCYMRHRNKQGLCYGRSDDGKTIAQDCIDYSYRTHFH